MSAAWPKLASMLTSDGVRLDADIYTPKDAGAYPVLLLRQAYGRKVASTLCYAHPAWYAAHGYIVVVQDVRGRGTSEGTFEPFLHEARDGAETIAWAAAIPGSTGLVGTYGFSYQGTNQLLAATLAGPELKAMAPAMIGWDLRQDWAYEGGGFNLLGNLAWALQLESETARRAEDTAGFAALRAAAMTPPFQSEVAAWPQIARERLADGLYGRWFDRQDDAYWDTISPASRADALVRRDIPSAFIGGWFDTHLPGTIAGYRALAGARSQLLVGPWWHFPWDRRIAGVDFGPAAVGDVDRMQLRWFDRWLKGSGGETDPAVSLFDMGANVWRTFNGWPGDRSATFQLASSGRSSVDIEAGRLVSEGIVSAMTDRLVHDPWRPAPSVGGAYGMPSGPAERSAVDSRSDVLTYTSAPLVAPLSVAGEVRTELCVESDAFAFDLALTLGRVLPDGRCQTVTTGFLSPAPVRDGVAVAPLRATCATFLPGERVRLSVALAAFPAHPVNPGTGAVPAVARAADAQVITLALACTGASRLILTLAETAP